MPVGKLDVAASRKRPNYSKKEYLLRCLWLFLSIAFRYSPRFAFFYRAWLLRAFGAKIGARTTIYPGCSIALPWMVSIGDDACIADGATLYCLGPMSIGCRVVISQNAYLCGGTHEYECTDFALLRSPVVIEEDCWICAGAFVGPNVTVGARSVVGAMSVVSKNCEPDSVYAGNPAKRIKTRILKERSDPP